MDISSLKFNPAILRNTRLSQKVMATQLAKDTGIHRSTLYAIEKGVSKNASFEDVAKIALALRIPLDCLFYFSK
jgi:transcriptional regulator with XRE-family HTH domain